MPEHISMCLLILVAKRYMSGFPNFSAIFWKRAGLSFHSIASYSTLDCLSASILTVPGICAAESHNWFLVQKSNILQAISLQVWDFIPHILLT